MARTLIEAVSRLESEVSAHPLASLRSVNDIFGRSAFLLRIDVSEAKLGSTHWFPTASAEWRAELRGKGKRRGMIGGQIERVPATPFSYSCEDRRVCRMSVGNDPGDP